MSGWTSRRNSKRPAQLDCSTELRAPEKVEPLSLVFAFATVTERVQRFTAQLRIQKHEPGEPIRRGRVLAGQPPLSTCRRASRREPTRLPAPTSTSRERNNMKRSGRPTQHTRRESPVTPSVGATTQGASNVSSSRATWSATCTALLVQPSARPPASCAYAVWSPCFSWAAASDISLVSRSNAMVSLRISMCRSASANPAVHKDVAGYPINDPDSLYVGQPRRLRPDVEHPLSLCQKVARACRMVRPLQAGLFQPCGHQRTISVGHDASDGRGHPARRGWDCWRRSKFGQQQPASSSHAHKLR